MEVIKMEKRIDSATNLMKALKALKTQFNDICADNTSNSTVPAYWDYDTEYSYQNNIEEIEKLFSEESRIRIALDKYNCTHQVEGYKMTIAEALVRMGQLKSLISNLTVLANKSSYYRERASYNSESIDMKTLYDVKVAKEDLKKYQRELSRLQVAVDKTNINSKVEY